MKGIVMISMNSPTLYTERLILRQFSIDDLEALYRTLKDEEANTFLPWLPFSP